ncbi:ICMT-domain-containing protein [Coprinellus micaceus]|uniref:Protein-S-isoprenylcysteine O-methyltransferase n=1 Tax=Coprinellus micaceus TaxID=71717 RepID=A0A4Y7T6T1_COPMI|nr:ICMT-domain-containing protein [Coprinellus micaceus]
MENWSQPMLKAASLLVSATYVHLSLSPPNPPVQKEECYRHKDNVNTLFETFVQYITFCSKTMVWMAVAAELFVTAIYHALRATPPWRYECLWTSLHARTSGDPPPWATECSPFILLGATLIAFGTVLRLWCFRTLGPLFTFEITIRPKHELVTSGPYAWVRHPSYAGIYVTLTGASLLFLTPNATWVNASGTRTWLGMLLVAFWCVKCIFAFRGTCLRVSAEDQVLKETFGEEWEVYRERVPWRLAPWVF